MNTELRVGENVGFRAISNPFIFYFLLYILALFVCLFGWFVFQVLQMSSTFPS